MSAELQSILAATLVVMTLGAFVWRAFRVPKGGCGGGCGCSMKANQKQHGKSSESL